MQAIDDPIKNKTTALRDWVYTPLMAVASAVILFILLNAVAGLWYPPATSAIGCLVMNDPTTGVRGIPNCACKKGIPESPRVEYRFNECGYRTAMRCNAPKDGVYRIVLIGSSMSFGQSIDQASSFSALLPGELSAKTGQRVELFNASMQWGFPKSTVLRFKDALAQKPDLILWGLTPRDISSSGEILPDMHAAATSSQGPREPGREALTLIMTDRRKLESKAMLLFRNTPLSVLLQHLIFASRSQYIASSLAGSDNETGFLKKDLSPQWNEYLKQFDDDAAGVEAQAEAAGIPLMAVLLPNRVQVAMLASRDYPPKYDPYRLEAELQRIVVSHGGRYISVLHAYSSIASPEKEYFPVDGHPDERGHATIARLLTNEMTSGVIPELAAHQAVANGAGRP